jgi:DNA-directed RNA polymerase III subunit RPC2
LGVEDIQLIGGDQINSKENFFVFLNGILIGIHRYPKKFVKEFRYLRRKGLINRFVSISLGMRRKSVNIASDYGRLTRPIVISYLNIMK